MKSRRRYLQHSLVFRTITPVILIAVLAWTGLYFFVLRSVSRFADERIHESFVEMAHSIYFICDRSLDDLLQSSNSSDPNVQNITKSAAIGSIEDFMRENRLMGLIRHGSESVFMTDDTPQGIADAALTAQKKEIISHFSFASDDFYLYHMVFEPWEWDIVLIKNTADYAALKNKVTLAYGFTGFILTAVTLLFINTLRRNIRIPLNKILEPIGRGELPSYRGISEFEHLSNAFRTSMEMKDRETQMLNNIYHLAAVKKGKDFFDEVTTAITRLYSHNAFIAKLCPDGSSADLISLTLNNELRREFDFSCKGTPCEKILATKELIIIDSDLRLKFPQIKFFEETRAECFIGFAIFNSKGVSVGIIGSFGSQYDFTESDIKVLQTIGQIVASEFERSDEEKEKELIREQLFQSQKMEAIGTLAGGVAHDFNNMLQGILGNASLLKIRLQKGTSAYECADNIEHISERAAQLTKQLLGFARKGKYLVGPISVNDVIRGVLKIISKTFDRNIAIETDLSTENMAIEGDRSQIEQVILNLCLNARDAMPGGGKLLIESYIKHDTFDSVTSPQDPSPQVAIKITDTGLGIPESVREHIFEPFFTTKEVGKGTGMGLAMVYGVVKNHGGSVHVETSPGKGTVFVIYFPAMKPAVSDVQPEWSAPAFSPESTPAQGEGTILMVDDEEYIRQLYQTMLVSLGYRVFAATNGKEALDIYTRHREIIDLVILDLMMPVMSGKETFDRLRQINDKVIVLIASGQTAAENRSFPAEQELLGFIRKPFTLHSIAEKVKAMLRLNKVPN